MHKLSGFMPRQTFLHVKHELHSIYFHNHHIHTLAYNLMQIYFAVKKKKSAAIELRCSSSSSLVSLQKYHLMRAATGFEYISWTNNDWFIFSCVLLVLFFASFGVQVISLAHLEKSLVAEVSERKYSISGSSPTTYLFIFYMYIFFCKISLNEEKFFIEKKRVSSAVNQWSLRSHRGKNWKDKKQIFAFSSDSKISNNFLVQKVKEKINKRFSCCWMVIKSFLWR